VIKNGQNEAAIESLIFDQNHTHQLSMKINKKGKKILWNTKPIMKTSDLLTGIITVYFSPEDDRIFSGAPAERRLFIDTLLSKLSPEYLLQLITLKHTVKLLNIHYKQHHKPDFSLVELYHEGIVKATEKIEQERRQLLMFLESKMNQHLQKITKNNIKFRYESSLVNTTKKSRLEHEYKYRDSCYGAHRDEVIIVYNGFDVRRGISLGERRLLGVLLRVSEKEIWQEEKKRRPLLLLDDAFLAIDNQRQEQLTQIVTQNVQVIITTTTPPQNASHGLTVAFEG
jgi:DNA replication and repair protein RecF